MLAYKDDVAVAPRDLIATGEEWTNGVEELADLGVHGVWFSEIQVAVLCFGS